MDKNAVHWGGVEHRDIHNLYGFYHVRYLSNKSIKVTVSDHVHRESPHVKDIWREEMEMTDRLFSLDHSLLAHNDM